MEQQLVDIIQTLFNDAGRVDPAIYNSFWTNCASDPQFASCFLAALVGKLLALETGLDEKSTLIKLLEIISGSEDFVDVPKKPELTELQKVLKEDIVNTINFVTQFCEFDTTVPILQKAHAKWTKYRGTKREFVDEVFRKLGTPQALENISLPLVEQCSSVVCARGLASPPPPVEVPLTAGSMAPALIHTFLRGLLADGVQVQAIYDKILLFMKHPGITEGRLLSLMHMLTTFLAFNPAIDTKSLLSATALVKQFYLWPVPYGSVAQEVLKLITDELICPGSIMRETIFPGSSIDKGAHVIVNTASFYGRMFMDVLSSQPAEVVEESEAKYQLLTSLLRIALEEENTAEDYGLGKCSDDDIAALYEQALAAAQVDEEGDAEAARETYLAALKDIAKAAGKKAGKEVRYEPKATPLLSSLPLSLTALNEKGLPTNECGTTNLTATITDMPTVTAIDILSAILSQYTADAANIGEDDDPIVVKIGVAGGDGTLQATVTGYVTLRHIKPELFENVCLRFYLIPVGARNTYASFLAAYDGWYYRHVFGIPQATLRVLPFCWGDPKSLEREVRWNLKAFGQLPSLDDDREPLIPPSVPHFPGTILKQEMENYFREARQQLNVPVFFCEITGSKDKSGKPYHRTLAFCHRVEIGIAAYTRNFMRAKDCDPLLTDEGAQGMKQFKFSPPDVSMSFTEMSMSGLTRPSSAESSKTYWSLVVANAPRAGDRGVMPDPTTHTLEVYALDASGGKQMQKGKAIDGERTWHVSSIEVSAKDQKSKSEYSILIDGELFDNILSFKVFPCTDPITNAPLCLPMMTYCPIAV